MSRAASTAMALPVAQPAPPPLNDDLAVARGVFDAEARGLAALSAALDGPFGLAVTRVVDRLAALTGRVVVSGMGKSGHVGRKVAATFASLGTPALFVHPAEASHGDLGMVQPGDAVLAISNSGETAELADIVAYTRRFGVLLIAMTARTGSTLGRSADLVLALPDAAEACPITAAPTTSTTMQLALGDALAVALLRRRGFTATDFSAFHPGGKLGARLLAVRDLMHRGDAVPVAPRALPMPEALLLMTGKGFGCIAVVEPDGRLAGIVTDGDLRRVMGPDLLRLTVAEVMNREPTVIAADLLAVEALRVMNERRRPITSLFVLDADGRPEGVLHVHDLLRAGIA